MQAIFGLTREQHNRLYFDEYTNDSGILHFHSPIELYFVDGGEMEVFVNDKRRILRAGEMSVALSFDAHAYATVGTSRSSVLIIPSYMCEEFSQAIRHKRAVTPFICDKEAVKSIKDCFSKIKECGENSIKMRGYIYVILGIIMEHINLESIDEPLDSKLSSKLLFYINENYKSNVTLATVSQAFGYTPEHLSRYFKSCFKIGINRYITMVRLKNALELMHEGRHTVLFCAMESGFNSVRTFYRAFAEEFHCSPSEYLKSVGIDAEKGLSHFEISE